MKHLQKLCLKLKRWASPLLFSPVFRLTLLRILLPLSIFNVIITTSTLVLDLKDGYTISYDSTISFRWLLCSACVFIHILLGLLVLFPLNALYVAFFIFPIHGQWTAVWQIGLVPYFFVWDLDEQIMILGVTARIQMYLYTLLFTLTIASVARVGVCRFFLSFDLVDPLEGCNDHKKKFLLGVPQKTYNGPKHRPDFRLRLRLLFGKALAGDLDVGEGKLTSFIRKFVAVGCFGFFIVVIGYTLLVKPMRGSVFRQVKTYYGRDITGDIFKTMEEYELSIIIFAPHILAPFINTSVTIEPQWKDRDFPDLMEYLGPLSEGIQAIKEVSESNCTIPTIQESSPPTGNEMEYDNTSDRFVELGMWVSRCPGRVAFKKNTKPSDRIQISLDSPMYLTTPDLLISVNWSSIPHNETFMSGRDFTLSVLVDMARDPDLAMLNTKPIHLLPNTNLIVNVVRYLRQMYQAPLSTTFDTPLFFGTGKLRSFVAAEIASIISDPHPPASNLTVLRIYHQYNAIRSLRIERDNAEGAFLSGLSTLGGLWTVSNVVYTFLFGGTLSMTLFGLKYFTHFGLIHKLNNQSLREGYSGAYPQLLTEGGSKGDPEAGMATFLRDYAFDMRPIERESKASDKLSESGYRRVLCTDRR